MQYCFCNVTIILVVVKVKAKAERCLLLGRAPSDGRGGRSALRQSIPPRHPHHTPAMQSLSRSAYSDAFSYSDPKATGSLLKARMAAAREVNERLAQYFSERADVSVQLHTVCVIYC